MFENAGAALVDIGDGVAAFTHKTKMNIYDEAVFDALGVTLGEVRRGFRALVIGGDHPKAFSCGADLGYFLGRMKAGDYAAIERFLELGQERFLAVKYAPFPVVAAASGLALGGGCETLMHVSEVVAYADLSAGLPESTLGILPGWGGCTQLAIRAPDLAAPFALILGGKFGRSAREARQGGVLRPSDPIVTDRAELIGRAKSRALSLADDYKAPAQDAAWLPGPAGKAALMSTLVSQGLSENDLAVAEALATVLTGGGADPRHPLHERDLMKLEREAVISLAHRPATFARIEHMLAFGKPLRN